MTRRKKSKKKKTTSIPLEMLVILTGAVLTVCAISVAYGFFVRHNGVNVPATQFRIEVLNGTGTAGLAQKTARTIIEKGIDVLRVDNADSFQYKKTVLIGRKRDVDLKQLAGAIGCDNTIVQIKEDSFVDATLIIGTDYHSLGVDAQSK